MPNYHCANNRKDNRIFWTDHIQNFHLSGLSQKDYCQKHNLVYSSFGYWKRRLENGAEKNGIEFVEVRPDQYRPDPPAVTLSTDRFDIRIHNGADPELIDRILEGLRK